jgi:DNA-binding XRE family transcriptional regulator
MTPKEITALRGELELSQNQFGQLFGVHPMTVSRWERATLQPSLFQRALMRDYAQAAARDPISAKKVGSMLIEQGIASAIFFLLQTARAPNAKTQEQVS